MPHAQTISTVRHLVADALLRPGDSGDDSIRESILIRAGMYCGRRFDTNEGYAIWFAEENQVKIFERGGRVTHVLQVDDPAAAPRQHRLAA